MTNKGIKLLHTAHIYFHLLSKPNRLLEDNHVTRNRSVFCHPLDRPLTLINYDNPQMSLGTGPAAVIAAKQEKKAAK